MARPRSPKIGVVAIPAHGTGVRKTAVRAREKSNAGIPEAIDAPRGAFGKTTARTLTGSGISGHTMGNGARGNVSDRHNHRGSSGPQAIDLIKVCRHSQLRPLDRARIIRVLN